MGWAARILIAVMSAMALLTIPPARAEQTHSFDIINASSRGMYIDGWMGRCVYTISTGGKYIPLWIAAGNTARISWDDDNNDGDGCTNKDKWVAFTFTMDSGAQWGGWLGITHRNLSGSSWYNGQFYAQFLYLVTGNVMAGGDGNPPPGWIQALCTNGNNCFGPWSEMEMAGKDDYNWPRFYQTEGGWAFRITDP